MNRILLPSIIALIWLKLVASAFLGTEDEPNYANKAIDASLIIAVATLFLLDINRQLAFFKEIIVGMMLLFAAGTISALINDVDLAETSAFLAKIFLPILIVLVFCTNFEIWERQKSLIKATFFLCMILTLIGIALLPPTINREESWLPAYFSNLHTSAYVLCMSIAGLFFLKEMGNLGRHTFNIFAVLSVLIIVLGWGVRTSMVVLAVFFFFHRLEKKQALHTGYLFLPSMIAAAMGAVLLIDALTSLSLDYTRLSSGRIEMWNDKIDSYFSSSFTQMLFGNGYGSDMVLSDVWWWAEKNSHNDFLTVLMEYGLLGLASLIFLLISIIRKFSVTTGSLSLWLGVIASGALSNGILFRPTAGVVLSLALIACLMQRSARRHNPTSPLENGKNALFYATPSKRNPGDFSASAAR